MKKSKYIFGLIVVALCVGLCYFVCKEIKHKQQLKVKNMGYTQYDLSESELFILKIYSDISVPGYSGLGTDFYEENEYNKDKDKFVLEKGSQTDIYVERLNKEIFYENRFAGEIIQTAARFGITKDTPFSSDWILTHPKEYLEILKSDDYEIFRHALGKDT